MSAHDGLWGAIFLAVLAFAARGVTADDSSWHRIVDDMSVYLPLLPVELASGTPRSLHSAEPHGRDTHHVVIGLFNTASERRISLPEVRAKLVGRGPLGREQRIEPMRIAGAISYGTVFSLPD